MTASASVLTAHAPGTLMLMGEHAVLHGQPALCAAVNRRMHLYLQPGTGREAVLVSSLGELTFSVDDPPDDPRFRFLLEVVRRQKPRSGFHLRVVSDFTSTVGFGSSAAVTVSLTALLREAAGKPFDRNAVFLDALETVRSVQGSASGSDVAAAVYGHLVHYRADPLHLDPMMRTLPLSVCYAGYKTPTPGVIQFVEKQRARYPDRYNEIFQVMGHCVEEAVTAIRNGDLQGLGLLFNLHHGLQSALGCSDSTLEFLVHALRKHPSVTGSKISGSGLGDCVIGLGDSGAEVTGYEHFAIETSGEGVTLETRSP